MVGFKEFEERKKKRKEKESRGKKNNNNLHCFVVNEKQNGKK